MPRPCIVPAVGRHSVSIPGATGLRQCIWPVGRFRGAEQCGEHALHLAQRLQDPCAARDSPLDAGLPCISRGDDAGLTPIWSKGCALRPDAQR